MSKPRVSTPDIVHKTWGYEHVLVNRTVDPAYCGKILTVLPNGRSCSVHYHAKKTETFYVLQGTLNLELYKELPYVLSTSSIERQIEAFKGAEPEYRIRLAEGQTITVNPYTPHRFWTFNTTCKFIEVSSPDDEGDSIRLVQPGVAVLFKESDVFCPIVSKGVVTPLAKS